MDMRAFYAAAILILCATTASAIIDDDINSLGAYFDNTGSVYCFVPTPATPFNLYWILAHPIAENLGGYEFAWGYSPDIVPAPFVLGTTLPPGALNIGSNYNLIVGLGSGLVTSEATVLASFTLMVITQVSPATYVVAGPATPASIPGHAATNDFTNPADIIPMTFHFVADGGVIINEQGWTEPGIAKFRGDCGGTATESATLGNIKALFR
jgi:hypothetical protein